MAYVQGVTRDSYILKIKNAQDQVQLIHVSTRAEVILINSILTVPVHFNLISKQFKTLSQL